MLFNDTVSFLKTKLQEPLPGLDSHRKYMPLNGLRPKAPENSRNSAVLILLYPSGEKVYFPLILRPKYDGTHGGQVALPGGKEEERDENLVRTALREAQEEIGIKAIDVSVLGELTDVYVPVSNFIIHPVIGYIDYEPEFFPDAREVEEIYSTSLSDILHNEEVARRTIKVRNQDMSVPGFEINDSWVWGATSLILSELSDIIKSFRA